VLDELLGTAVQQAYMWVDPRDNLTIKLKHQPQHAVRGRMLGTEVDVELANFLFSHAVL
jgi:hypothetical protein